jgi:hypothetical protein
VVALGRRRLQGIVSKRRAAGYASGTSRHWVKIKCESWRDANQHLHKLLEGPRQIEPSPRERELMKNRLSSRAFKSGCRGLM